jgi:hypothetical protein
MRGPALLAAALAALALAGSGRAEEVTRTDAAGRLIHFDVRAQGVDVDWYAGQLSRAAHGDEISTVTIRIVAVGEVGRACGTREAGGCYGERGRSRIVVPAGYGPAVAHTLLHEYGHHLDATRRHDGAPEPNGTRRWWLARGLPRLLELASVARSYRLGWDRSIAEIYAEDYAYVHVGGRHRIDWLEPPDDEVRAALLADLGVGDANVTAPAEPAVKPVVLTSSGVLGPGERRSLSFGLLGPGRRVTLTARVTDGSRGRVEIACSQRRYARGLAGRAVTTLDVRNLGPSECVASIRSASAEPFRFSVRLRLAVR